MNRVAFLATLRDGLAGLPGREVDDILGDYTSYFDEANASGRSEEEVAAALGDPRRLARELRAESGLRRLENQGLLASEWREEEKRNKRFYRLSTEGKQILKQLTAEWKSINESLNGIL